METEQFTKITGAVHHCLAGCYTAKSPLAYLAAYTQMLRADEDWREWEILCVEKTVRRMLLLIAQPSRERVESDQVTSSSEG